MNVEDIEMLMKDNFGYCTVVFRADNFYVF